MEGDYIELEEPITLYCPVLVGCISISSDTLDSMGEFTKFILWALGQKHTIKDLVTITHLNEWLIQEEIEYLTKIRFVIEENNHLKLSAIGERYFNLLNYVKKFNDSRHPINIDCYTGKIGKCSDNLIAETERRSECQTFNVRIVKQLYQNKNPENTLEYFLTTFQHDEIAKEDLDTLYTKIDYERKDVYKELKLSKLPHILRCSDLERRNTDSYNFVIKRKLAAVTIIPKDSKLDNYRTVIPTLEILDSFDSDLLSIKSQKLIRRSIREKKIKELAHDILIEKNHGTVIELSDYEKLNFERNNYRAFEVNLKNDINIHNLDFRHKINNFQVENKHIDDCILEVKPQEISCLQICNYYDYFD